MINHFTRAPHVEGAGPVLSSAPNAALLIDFDNVTMGIRSDLSKEIKTLLNSDIIKGKVTVQRAYADWRRYPQYIVPLSEASVDLIFAPAYGSSKKNATDIRMAIDGMELVFIRPEIGTYILLTGDSDFSSLVLKLKEYGKYVIGVGIQESSSDILVQNCDEYYSYSSITGLQKASAGDKGKSVDPWNLVSAASKKMIERGDVMRSDRLKQVMLELSPGFEESKFGFSKFSKFLAEAASRGLLRLRKLENGQHEVLPPGARRRDAFAGSSAPQQAGARRRTAESGAPERKRTAARGEAEPSGRASGREGVSGDGATGADPLQDAYALLRKALPDISPDNSWTRDSDLKRRMLDLDRGFDEAELGFSKFSKFLTQAHEDEIVRIRRNEAGNFVVRLPRSDRARAAAAPPTGSEDGSRSPAGPKEGAAAPDGSAAASPSRGAASEAGKDDPASAPALAGSTAPAEPATAAEAPSAKKGGRTPRSPRLRMWRQSQRAREREKEDATREKEDVTRPKKDVTRQEKDATRQEKDVTRPKKDVTRPKEDVTRPKEDVTRPKKDVTRPKKDATREQSVEARPAFDPGRLGLPTDAAAVQRYLANRYRGVGEKTAERLIGAFGDRVFHVLHDSIDKLESILPRNRAAKVEEAWLEDFGRRSKAEAGSEQNAASPGAATRKKAATPTKAVTAKKAATPKKAVTSKKAATPEKTVASRKAATPKKAAIPQEAATPKKAATSEKAAAPKPTATRQKTAIRKTPSDAARRTRLGRRRGSS